jgi:hypothetical protein
MYGGDGHFIYKVATFILEGTDFENNLYNNEIYNMFYIEGGTDRAFYNNVIMLYIYDIVYAIQSINYVYFLLLYKGGGGRTVIFLCDGHRHGKIIF